MANEHHDDVISDTPYPDSHAMPLPPACCPSRVDPSTQSSRLATHPRARGGHSQLQSLPRCRHLRQRDWIARSGCAGCATAVTGRRVGQSILGHTHRRVHPRRARSQAKRSRRDGPSPTARGNTVRCPLVPPLAPTLGMGSAGAGTGRVAQSARPGRPGYHAVGDTRPHGVPHRGGTLPHGHRPFYSLA